MMILKFKLGTDASRPVRTWQAGEIAWAFTVDIVTMMAIILQYLILAEAIVLILIIRIGHLRCVVTAAIYVLICWLHEVATGADNWWHVDACL